MTTEILREAARLMRKRAQAAIHDSDGEEWHLGPEVWDGNVSQVLIHIDGTEVPIADGCSDPDARHIASWHPTVALAVADWLESTAVISQWGDYVGPGPVDRTVKCALAVARAYLGGDQ
jgi:hypothetical protein